MFHEIKPKDINQNAFSLYPDNWALLSAGNQESYNTMTISWGGFGYLWAKDIAYVYVRPSRYTYDFMEREDYFTITFLKDGYKNDLNYLGKVSGRDEDKIANTKLTPVFVDGHPTFKEAKYVVVCKKAYVSDINMENFVDDKVASVYTDGNLHRQYIGTVVKAYKRNIIEDIQDIL